MFRVFVNMLTGCETQDLDGMFPIVYLEGKTNYQAQDFPQSPLETNQSPWVKLKLFCYFGIKKGSLKFY